MKVTELTREQLRQLKATHFNEMPSENGSGVKYLSLAEIDKLVSDEEIFEEFEGVDFSEDLFS